LKLHHLFVNILNTAPLLL
jgi:hypothetical protein